MNFDDKCQLLIIGNSSVGKTSILTRYSSKTFNENYIATVGLDFFSKDETIDNKIIRIKIWDTAGQERYKSFTKCFFQKAQGIMIVYDVTSQKSFTDLQYWIESLKHNMYQDISFVPIIIIGNKIDLPKREVTKEEAANYALEHQFHYYETSAKTGEGIDLAIRELVKKVMNGGKKNGNNNINLNQTKKKSGKCCQCVPSQLSAQCPSAFCPVSRKCCSILRRSLAII